MSRVCHGLQSEDVACLELQEHNDGVRNTDGIRMLISQEAEFLISIYNNVYNALMLESVRSVAGIVLINKVNTIFVIGGGNYDFYANYIFEILMKQELKIISLSLQYD